MRGFTCGKNTTGFIGIAIHPELHRHGLGSLLLGRLEEHYRQAGIDYLGSAFSASADLLPFWRKAGLEVLREDNRAIVRAASQASKAADWLLGFLPEADTGMADDEREAA